MGNPPAFQFYAADYLADADVQMMSLEEEGVYIRLLAYCWREGSIPSEESMLSRLCKNASHEVIRVVTKCFQPNGNGTLTLVHKRLDLEREKQEIWRQKSSIGGKKSAKNRWGNKSKNKGGGKGGYKMVDTVVQPNGNSSSSSSSSIIPPTPKGDCELILDFLNEKAGSQFRPIDCNLSPIKIRMDEHSASVDEIKKMISRQCDRWKGTDYEQFLRPSTLFNRTKFSDYYGQRNNQTPKNGKHQPPPAESSRNIGTANEGGAKHYNLSEIQARRAARESSIPDTQRPAA